MSIIQWKQKRPKIGDGCIDDSENVLILSPAAPYTSGAQRAPVDLEWCLEAGITGPYKPHLLLQKQGIVAALQAGKEKSVNTGSTIHTSGQGYCQIGWLNTSNATSPWTYNRSYTWGDRHRPVGDRKKKYSNGRKCQKYKHETNKRTHTVVGKKKPLW